MKYTKKQREEIKKFRKYEEDNYKIERKLRKIAGWTSDEFKQIINLLEKGRKENKEHIERLRKGLIL